MRVIKSTEIQSLFEDCSDEEKLWVYNGLDCGITLDLYWTLKEKLDPETTQITYDFERAMQAPAMTMQRRGMRVDTVKRDELIKKIIPEITSLGGMAQDHLGRWKVVNEDSPLQRLAKCIWDKQINYNSVPQLKKFLYGELRIPEYYTFEKGKRKISTKREVLENICDYYPRARPFLKTLLKIRDLEKQLSVLHAELEPDGRMKYSFGIAGTETGRWNSKQNCYKRGTNIQNITHDLREIFIPDEGWVMFYADLKTAESKAVAYLSEDEGYINACNNDDPHTIVAAMAFGIPAERDSADELYYRHFSYRDMAKRGGHGTNYYGTPRTMGRYLKVEEKVMKKFQALYYGGLLTEKELDRWGFEDMKEIADKKLWDKENSLYVYAFNGAFPGIKRWHNTTSQDLQSTGKLTTPLGRKRQFWGRLWTDETLREGIAFKPQSLVGDILNIGLFKVWKMFDGEELQILANGHDAIVGQVRAECVDKYRELIPQVARTPVMVNGREMIIEYDIKFGKNWKEVS